MKRCQSPIANRQSLSRHGQSLIEVMVAITLLTVGFLGIASLLSQSLVISRVTTNELTATYLASEGIEIAKNLIDHDVYLSEAQQGSGFGTCFGEGGTFELDYTTDACSQSTSFMRGSGDYLFYHADTHLYDYNETNDPAATKTDFMRYISVSDFPASGRPYEITIHSIVNWSGLAGTPSSIDLEDHFYDWNN